MKKSDAYKTLLAAVQAASSEQVTDLRDILELGAGYIPLPEGSVMSGPESLCPERREPYISLVDAVQLEQGDEFTPIRSGDWETVLASLVIMGDWQTIHQIADDLRSDPEFTK